MINFQYLYQGLCGLANASKTSGLAGHLGAAVAAGYFIGEDQPDLPGPVGKGIEGELDRIIAGEEAIWYNVKKTGIKPNELFKKLPAEKPTPQATKSIAQALEKNIQRTRQSGHNVIFAAIALRALHDHPDYATPTMIRGITKLTQSFDNAHAGRGYYGKDKGWKTGRQIELPKIKDHEKYKDLRDLARTTINELIASAPIRDRGFGGLVHLINHAAAIVELHRYGYPDLAKKALPAHYEHLRLLRTLPNLNDELGPPTKSTFHPRDSKYWKETLRRDSAQLTHRIKTIYGFYSLLPYMEDDTKTKPAEDAFLYLMS